MHRILYLTLRRSGSTTSAALKQQASLTKQLARPSSLIHRIQSLRAVSSNSSSAGSNFPGPDDVNKSNKNNKKNEHENKPREHEDQPWKRDQRQNSDRPTTANNRRTAATNNKNNTNPNFNNNNTTHYNNSASANNNNNKNPSPGHAEAQKKPHSTDQTHCEQQSTSWTDSLKEAARKLTHNITHASHASKNMANNVGLEPVQHEPARSRFVMDLGNNRQARIDYRKEGGDCVNLYHTEVPVDMRGQGLARHLAQGALDQLEKDGLKVKLSCSYLQDYVRKFAQNRYSNLIGCQTNNPKNLNSQKEDGPSSKRR